jgi:hypothetical protein
MKKIVILLLSVTSMFAVAETYQFKAPISPIIEESVFTTSALSLPAAATLAETGPRGTISLRGSNGLTSSSYSVSSSYRSYYGAERAFNGLDSWGAVLNPDYDVLDGRYQWMASGSAEGQWIQIDFTQEVNIARFAINKATSSDRLPRDTIMQISNDGINWVNHQEAAFLETLGWQSITLDTPAITRFFRLYILNGHGGSRISIDELEIYQN